MKNEEIALVLQVVDEAIRAVVPNATGFCFTLFYEKLSGVAGRVELEGYTSFGIGKRLAESKNPSVQRHASTVMQAMVMNAPEAVRQCALAHLMAATGADRSDLH